MVPTIDPALANGPAFGLDDQFRDHLLTAHRRRSRSLLAADEIDHSIGKASRLFEVPEVAAVMEFDEP